MLSIKAMKPTFILLFLFIIISCTNNNADIEVAEIRLHKNSEEKIIIKDLKGLKEINDTSSRLEIEYLFNKKNIAKLKSGIFQIDNKAKFKLYLNDHLLLDNSSTFFMDTLLSLRPDSFLFSDTLHADYFIDSLKIANSILTNQNRLLVKYENQNFHKLNHYKTTLLLSKKNTDFPTKTPSKSITPSILPWISISTKQGIKDEPKQLANILIRENNSLISESIKIEIRGNTSQSFKKKSYSFLFIDNNKSVKKVGVLGLPKHEHWVLYGPYADKSLIRNVLAYNLFEKMGYYAPRTKFCELSINGLYQGVYVLCEKIRVDSVRLVENGYLLKIDRPKESFFKSNIKNRDSMETVFEILHPRSSELTNYEKNAVKNFIHLFEKTLLLSDSINLSVFEIIDMNSFVDFLIINEFSKNIDAYRLSTYFQISKQKRILMGPIWDFNFSFGLTNYLQGYSASGFVYNNKHVPFWWEKLTSNIFFKSALKKRWKNLRGSIFKDEAIILMIDKYVDDLNLAQENNFTCWLLLGTEDVWPNYFIGKSHEEEIDYLKTWINQRAEWLDKQWGY